MFTQTQILSRLLETDDTFGRELNLNRREWQRAVKFPCYIRHLYGNSIDMHVLDFKWKSVNFDNLFRNKIFGLQLFVNVESFLIHVSGIRPW